MSILHEGLIQKVMENVLYFMPVTRRLVIGARVGHRSIKGLYYKIVALESKLRSCLHLKLLTNVSRPQYMLSLLCYNNRYVFN